MIPAPAMIPAKPCGAVTSAACDDSVKLSIQNAMITAPRITNTIAIETAVARIDRVTPRRSSASTKTIAARANHRAPSGHRYEPIVSAAAPADADLPMTKA